MTLITSIEEWKNIRHSISNHTTIGFVPTMGNLHRGHASLLQKARTENDIVVLSLFVNPTQFNEANDYKSYPRTLEEDLLIAKEHHVDYVLAPEESSLYPDEYRFRVSETEISQYQEGVFRPGHFTGMLTVVLKWLLLVQATRAYLGEKDYQQLHLVKNMAQAFFLSTDIIACPTIREEDGLPLSSRNRLLSAEERMLASQFAHIFQKTDKSCEAITNALLTAGIRVDYIEDRESRRFAAVKVGKIRLIDNRVLAQNEEVK